MQKLQFHEFRLLPAKSGVYVVFAGSTALYVGSSKNLKKRFETHKKRKQMSTLNADTIQFELCSIKDLSSVEMKTIYEHKPTLNGIVGRPLNETKDELGTFMSGKFSVTLELSSEEIEKVEKAREYLKESLRLTYVGKSSAVRFLIRQSAVPLISEQTQQR